MMRAQLLKSCHDFFPTGKTKAGYFKPSPFSPLEVPTIELLRIECGLQSRFSQKSISTKWRVYKENWTRSKEFLLEKKNRNFMKIVKNLSSSQTNLQKLFVLNNIDKSNMADL